jgi:hypothetical protein
MLLSLIFVVELALANAVAPSPQPSASSEPLKEIGHVYSSGMCTAIVKRANHAIASALHNNETVAAAVLTLRSVNLESQNGIVKHNGMTNIERLATDLRVSSHKADKEIKQLREISTQATDPVRKSELKAFADALGGALARQDKIGSDLQTMLLRMTGRDNEQEAYKQIQTTVNVVMPDQIMDQIFAPVPYNTVAHAFAKDLETRTVDIAGDESKAAEHVVGAVNGC